MTEISSGSNSIREDFKAKKAEAGSNEKSSINKSQARETVLK